MGEKVQILVDRLWDLYEGHTGSKKSDQPKQGQSQNGGQVRVTQPLSQQYSGNPNIDIPQQLQPQMTSLKSQTNEYSMNQQAEPDFNNMYAGPQNSLVGANSPMMEPAAANDGYGAFGSAF